jgi:drug/metabolite transporter (DMT)-like permease
MGARALLFTSAIFFGLSATLVRVATRDGMTAGQVTLVRFSFGLAAVLTLFRVRPGTFRPARFDLLASRGIFGAIAALLYFMAIQRISAGEATLLNNTFPFWAVLISIVLLGERPTLHLAVALLIASAGVFLVLGGGQTRFELGTGEILGIVSAMFGGAAVTAIRALRATANVPAPTVFFAFSLGGIALGLPSLAAPWSLPPTAWLAAAGVGVTAFLAQLSMTEAYGQLSVPEAALWQQLTPIASYLWGFALGETISRATAVGILLGVGGIVYGSAFGHRATPESPIAQAVPEIPAEEP